MKKMFLFFFCSLSLWSNVVCADNYTIVTESYITKRTHGVVAQGSSDEVTPESYFDVSCSLSRADALKGAIYIDINHSCAELTKAHPSFTGLKVQAVVVDDRGLYGFIESINGTGIGNPFPFLVTCHLNGNTLKQTI